MATSFKPSRLVAVTALVLVAGCDTVHANGSTDPGFGETAKYNAALQVIDPDPVVVAGASMPGSNGAVGAAAGKRYRTGTVTPVVHVQTTASGSSGPKR
jgi:hypothetical protein